MSKKIIFTLILFNYAIFCFSYSLKCDAIGSSGYNSLDNRTFWTVGESIETKILQTENHSIMIGFQNIHNTPNLQLTSNFEADIVSGYAPLNVQFTDLSIPAQNPITEWNWDFNYDGVIDSYNQNPTFTYNQTGVYTVSLTISDGSNEDTNIKEDYINVIEILCSDFVGTPLNGSNPLEVNFTDLSTGDPTTWLWDFDNDGFIDSNEQNPIYTYNDVGVYTVSLTVSDGSFDDTEIKVEYITVTLTSSQNVIIPIETKLYQNHPNPFNPLTNITFDIKDNEKGILSIYNIKGQLIESQQYDCGSHNFIWDATKQSSGLYLYKLIVNDKTISVKKCLLLK